MTQDKITDETTIKVENNGSATKPKWRMKALFIASVSAVGLIGFSTVGSAMIGGNYAKIENAFPNTSFDRIYKDEDTKLLVAEAGETIIYFTADQSYAIVGNVLDLENKVDLTDERKKKLVAANALEARAFGKPAPSARPSGPDTREAAIQEPPRPEVPSNLTVDLPMENMVVHNEGAGKIVYVVVDYNCSFCRRLFMEMEGLDFEIREIPVGFLGQDSRIKASAALCSDDPGAMAEAFFNGTADTRLSTCTEGDNAVAQNTEWVTSRGIGGTPFIITEDGRTNSGYLPAHRLNPFLGLGS